MGPSVKFVSAIIDAFSNKTSSKPSKMRYLKAAKFQHVKLKNLNTDLLPYGKRNAEKVEIWSYLYRFLGGWLDELMMRL